MSSEKVTFTGRVKWFNNKTGYGFLTIIQDSEWGSDAEKTRVGQDVFAHHSAIRVGKEQYRYLVQGEYVQFWLSDEVSDKYKYQASNICGLEGGPLLCETRFEQKEERTNYKPTQQKKKVSESQSAESSA